MKVAMYYNNSDVRLEEMEKPSISEGEILLKVMASGICGSDIMEWYRIKKAPLVLGHEVSGEVAEAGKFVSQFKIGDRVVVTHHVPCNSCHYCDDGNETMCGTLRTTGFHPGGFAEYLRVPEINVRKGTLKMPEGMSYESGTFVEPLGCVVRGQRRANIGKHHSLLILGSGLSGLLHIKLAKAKGVMKVMATDVSESRRKAAKNAGADMVFDARMDIHEILMKYNNGKLADRVIVCTGAVQAFRQAIVSADKGGTILFFAPTRPEDELAIKVEHLWKNGINLITSYAADRKDLEEAMKLISEGTVKLDDMITDRLSLDQTGEGFRRFAEGESIKVIITPHK